jgi:hypothetical protein
MHDDLLYCVYQGDEVLIGACSFFRDRGLLSVCKW